VPNRAKVYTFCIQSGVYIASTSDYLNIFSDNKILILWCCWEESNLRPTDYET